MSRCQRRSTSCRCFVRAGAVLALLPPDVDTLADYGAGAPGLVRLADRDRALHLLVFPRGRSEGRFLSRGRWRSTEAPDRWSLTARAERRSTWDIEVALGTLTVPFAPCSVRTNRRPLPEDAWTYDAASGVLRVRVEGRGVRLEARADCG